VSTVERVGVRVNAAPDVLYHDKKKNSSNEWEAFPFTVFKLFKPLYFFQILLTIFLSAYYGCHVAAADVSRCCLKKEGRRGEEEGKGMEGGCEGGKESVMGLKRVRALFCLASAGGACCRMRTEVSGKEKAR
jgi:hypothetical protein